jgi:hypothetical protein
MSNDLMIPSKDQLSGIGIVAEEFVENVTVEMPKPFFKIWEEYLVFCNDQKLAPLLFKKLLETYQHEMEYTNGRMNDLRNKFILSWLLCLIKSNSFKNGTFYCRNCLVKRFTITVTSFVYTFKEKSVNTKFFFEYSIVEVISGVVGQTPSKYCLSFLEG